MYDANVVKYSLNVLKRQVSSRLLSWWLETGVWRMAMFLKLSHEPQLGSRGK